MKLPDFTNDPHLLRLRQSMGASNTSDWTPGASWSRISTAEWKLLQDRGLDVSANDIDNADDGTLEYKGEKVIVYIRDQQADNNGGPKNYKYHIANCRTLDRMRQDGRSDRYVVTTGTNGIFRVNLLNFGKIIKQDLQLPLKVCKNCLERLNYDNYAKAYLWDEKNKIFDEFDLADFLSVCSPTFVHMPVHTDKTQPLNMYPLDWSKLAARIKKDKNYTCENSNCKKKKSQHELHLHHRDGNKFNNRHANLQVLCLDCHRKQPHHQHMT